MLNEDGKFSLDAEILFPQAAKRVKILESLKKSWASVVSPALARHSTPYNLGINEISVAVDNKKAYDMLAKMKGNILRALLRFDYESDGEFNLNITFEQPEEINKNKKSLSDPKINKCTGVSDDELEKLMTDAPEDLPEDINYAISHLKIFLEKRFPNKNHKN
ncbi:MAG: DciA family protein [Synergistales bacterium]|nr:DciA family protein [Synergistales bacterium]MDY6401666.1 DciA family protein [Synergistales bacterium]MDY6404254.1 DciA family protein [Synergistales bacterium]MDY6411252.1 DciA family protein [Synergistales bacterium]MDY6415018.1 DciA family protein [Synergistales bacterium]